MKRWPLVVIGAGPAGIAAATEAVRQGVQPLLLDSTGQAGGIIRMAHEVRNIPFLDDRTPGESVANHLAAFLNRWNLSVTSGQAECISVTEQGMEIQVRQGDNLVAENVILALGTEPILPEIDGIPPQCIARSASEACTAGVPNRALVVGGSDVAMDQARWLRARRVQVEVLCRGRVRAPAWLTEAALQEGVLVSRETRILQGKYRDRKLLLRLSRGLKESTEQVDIVVAAVGRKPVMLAGSREAVEKRPRNVRIVGDGTGRRARHVVAALGDGCIAAAELLACSTGESR